MGSPRCWCQVGDAALPREESNWQTALIVQCIDKKRDFVAILNHVRQTVRRLWPSGDPNSAFRDRRQANRGLPNPSETTHFSGAGEPRRPLSLKALAGVRDLARHSLHPWHLRHGIDPLRHHNTNQPAFTGPAAFTKMVRSAIVSLFTFPWISRIAP